MSSFITVADITWLTPEGRALFTDLNLSFAAERSGLVGRNGVGKTTLLKLIAGESTPFSGKVSVGGTLGMLRQTVQVGPDETIVDLFRAADEYAIFRRAESGEASVEELSETDWTIEGRILSALGKMGLDAEPETRLAHLSGGQRTRAALAALVFGEADFLLLDEPTNNLDREGREAVIAFLSKWRAGCVVVSHDRELLETMDAIIELTSLGATRYGGNWSRYREQKAQELAAARDDLAHAEKRIGEIDRSTQATAERKARKGAAGARMKYTGGIPRIGLGLRKQRSEETTGDNARIADKRRTQAAEAAAAARERIEILQPLTVEVPPSGLPSGKTVLTIDAVTAGYEPGKPVLREFSMEVTGPERVAIAGPNGSGKTTMLHLLTGRLAPWSGSVRVHVDHALLDQRAELLDPELSIRDNFLRMHPLADENACRASLARFMFRADAALQRVGTLSGGQLLRAALACVLGWAKPPQLLILDEPTNHLDIDSIEAIEGGLRGYDGALVIVSHDEAFLEATGITRRVDLSNR